MLAPKRVTRKRRAPFPTTNMFAKLDTEPEFLAEKVVTGVKTIKVNPPIVVISPPFTELYSTKVINGKASMHPNPPQNQSMTFSEHEAKPNSSYASGITGNVGFNSGVEKDSNKSFNEKTANNEVASNVPIAKDDAEGEIGWVDYLWSFLYTNEATQTTSS